MYPYGDVLGIYVMNYFFMILAGFAVAGYLVIIILDIIRRNKDDKDIW